MESFAEVEQRFRRVIVTAPTHGGAHGVLTLDGEDSVIDLSGDLPLASPPPPGWFDLRLVDGRDRDLFVHNLLRQSMTFPGVGSSSRTAQYFPNMLVDNAEAVDAEGRVRSITFALDGWHDCFAYNYVETLDLCGSETPELSAALEAARHDFAREEPFVPEAVYLLHDLGMLVDFEANDLHYSIFAGRYERFGRGDMIDVRLGLLGTIIFPAAVSLDTATDACWDWRRFFNQMAMAPMAFTGMAVAASESPRAPRGNLYLPNQRCNSGWQRRRRSEAYHMPLNQWPERELLGQAMQTWLERQGERRVFRAALDRVLARPGHVAIEDAVALCAGVDTLIELSSRSPFPAGVLDAMTNAAVMAAGEQRCAVDQARVRGLLGGLQNDDLRRRLTRVASIAAPETPSENAARLIELVIGLRLFGAHGRQPSQDNQMISGPAVEGLAALCARYDLQEAGVPDHGSNGARSLPLLRWDEALMSIAITDDASAIDPEIGRRL